MCADLVADPDRLRREIDATAAGRGTADPQVAASLYAQAYAFRVPSIAVAAYALGLPVPSTAPAVTAVRIARHRPAELAILDPTCRPMGAAEVARMVVDEHLAPFVAAVRATTRIGERLLWGNVAASIAAIFRAVQGVGPAGDPDVRARAAGAPRRGAVARRPRRLLVRGGARGARLVLGPDELLPLVPDDGGLRTATTAASATRPSSTARRRAELIGSAAP